MAFNSKYDNVNSGNSAGGYSMKNAQDLAEVLSAVTSALHGFGDVDYVGSTLTDTTDGTIAPCTDTTLTDQSAVINKNFAELNAKLTELIGMFG